MKFHEIPITDETDESEPRENKIDRYDSIKKKLLEVRAINSITLALLSDAEANF